MIGTDIFRPGVAAARPAKARFMVIEGLSAVGKSTIAPLVSDRLGADLVESLLPSFDDVRVHVDRSETVMARLHFWLMCNYAVADMARAQLARGHDVVVESYFYRTLATHAAMGATHLPDIDWSRALRPDVNVLLTVGEEERRRRLTEREANGGLSYWSKLEEFNVVATRKMYESFGLTPLDTTGLGVAEVTERVTERFADAARLRHD